MATYRFCPAPVTGQSLNTLEEARAHRVPLTRFTLAIALIFAAMVGLYALLAPSYFFAETLHLAAVPVWALIIGLPLSLFEYLYHRYLLHSAILPFLASMHRSHTTHHGLTYVKAPINPKNPAQLVEVRSEFPVEHEHQEEAMMFPFYALPIFVAVFLVLFALPLKLLFPGAPILLALIFSVTAYYVAYEVWHAALHLPFERFWQPLFARRGIGPIARRCYSFHLVHHWRPNSNLALVGFWGIALWDHLFRTHRRPERIPLKGAEVTFGDSELPPPRWPIRLLDRWQGRLLKWSRRVEKKLARLFLGRMLRIRRFNNADHV